ncbi:lipopolysaccharide biosynthesis protein [Chroococcidiopsis sp.]|uniref:lipopolysaccharide biosynthesis protein n=1 Tax=Chroococcidiopsis sp. TaxID=3088168 RepID=UPI003F2DC389
MATLQQKPLTLRRNFSWNFVGNVVYAACQWGMLVVLAKVGSPEIVGQFTLGLAVTAPIFLFANLQLRTIQATDTKQQYVFGDYLALRLIATALAILALAGIGLGTGYRLETSLVILVVGVSKALESISDVFYGLIQQRERMDRIAISMMIKGPLSLLFLGLGVYLTRSVFWGAVGLAIAWAIVLLGYDIRSGALMLKMRPVAPQHFKDVNPDVVEENLRPRWHFQTLKQLIWLSLPLGVVMMLISLNGNMPRYFIERSLGDRELGIFAAISYLMVAGRMLVFSLGESASPRLAKYYAAGDGKAFRTLLIKLVGIAVLLGSAGVLVALIAGRQILTLLYQAEYAERADLFVWLMIVAGITYIASFLGYGMTAARYFRIQMPLFASVTAISALACFWLIPTRGLQGAAIALLIGSIVEVSTTTIVILHALHRLQTRNFEGQ